MSKQEAERLADALELVNECYPFTAIEDAIALLRQWPDGEPVMIYHGRCTIDCGEHGHHDMEMLKLIPKGTKLYPAPPDSAARIAELEAALKTALKELKEFRNRTIYGEDTF